MPNINNLPSVYKRLFVSLILLSSLIVTLQANSKKNALIVEDILEIPAQLIQSINLDKLLPLSIMEGELNPDQNIKTTSASSLNSNSLPVFFSIENSGNKTTDIDLKVDGNNLSSLENIAKTALSKTNPESGPEAKALALWGFTSNYLKADQPPDYSLNKSQFNNPLALFNTLGYGNCGNFASALTILADQTGLQSRRVDLVGHAVTEIFYDQKWHMFDANLGIIIRNNDGSIAGVDDIFNNRELIKQINLFPRKYPSSRIVFNMAFSSGKIKRVFTPEEVWTLSAKNVPRTMVYRLRPSEKITFFDKFSKIFMLKVSGFNPIKFFAMQKYLSFGILKTPLDLGHIETPYPIVSSYVHLGNNCMNAIGIFVSKNSSDWVQLAPPVNCLSKVPNDFFPASNDSKILRSFYIKSNLESNQNQPEISVYTVFQYAPASFPSIDRHSNVNGTILSAENLSSDIKIKFGFSAD